MKNHINKLIKFIVSVSFQNILVNILTIISAIICGAYFYKNESTISNVLLGLFVGFVGFMFISLLYFLLIDFLKKHFSVLKDVIYVGLFLAAILAAAIFISKYL
jgi:hypothetical protein